MRLAHLHDHGAKSEAPTNLYQLPRASRFAVRLSLPTSVAYVSKRCSVAQNSNNDASQRSGD